jgi:hypothetical protein
MTYIYVYIYVHIHSSIHICIGNKSIITVSKPLPKNSSQVKPQGTLIDAEIQASKTIICILEVLIYTHI